MFWETATARTLDNGEIELTAIIDGKVKIVTEASIRRHLQLVDFDGISSLPTTDNPLNNFRRVQPKTKSEFERKIPELAAGSSKRDAEEELDQETSKRQKTCEISELAEQPRNKEADELSQEELQQMMIIVLEQGMNVEALQTKYPKLTRRFTLKALRSTRRSSELDIILRFNSTEPTDNKEREIWVKLKRLFELDTDDELWKLQKHIHDLPWKIYDSCGVHHVSTEKGIDIYMLIEKEFPLSRGTLTQMLVAKLLVDQDNEMSSELLRKIFMQLGSTRINTGMKPKEPTYQVALDALALTTCYPAFFITSEVPVIYMHQFWATVIKHKSSDQFKIDKKRFFVNVEVFREILNICPKVPGKAFDEPPTE
ncbi:hypothetical protein Tco_1370917, partial [Tanacetum coccineum]